ncbi:MAG: VOC family protein [Candidatus Dormibacterales bacterium]
MPTQTFWYGPVAATRRALGSPGKRQKRRRELAATVQIYNTLLVDDLNRFMAGLAEHGIGTGPVETNGAGVRVTIVTDPDGNCLQLGQPPV